MRKNLFGLLMSSLILVMSCNSCKDSMTSSMMSEGGRNSQRISRPLSTFEMVEEMHGGAARLALESAIFGFKNLYPDKYESFVNENFSVSIEFYTQDVLRAIIPGYDVTGNDTLLYIVNFANNNGFALVGGNLSLLAINDNCNIYLSDFVCDITDERFLNNPGKWIIAGLINRDTYYKTIPLTKVPQVLMFNDYDSARVVIDSYDTIGPYVKMELSQNAPYNYDCFTPTGAQAVAGCAPIAIAGLFSANRHLDFYNADGFWWRTIVADWCQNHNSPNYDPVHNARLYALCKRISNIGGDLGTQYGVTESGTDTINIRRYLFPFYGACIWDKPNQPRFSYDYHDYLSHGVSLLATGNVTTNNSSSEGHAWVFDGEATHEFKSIIYNNGNSITIENADTLVHCRMGWGGSVDGYYYFGIFRPIPNDVLVDFNSLVYPDFPVSPNSINILWTQFGTPFYH